MSQLSSIERIQVLGLMLLVLCSIAAVIMAAGFLMAKGMIWAGFCVT